MDSSKLQIYQVQSGDSLGSIAQHTGKTVGELVRLNGIKNPNQIDVGQVLYLDKASAFSVQALFLDALRHPIENLVYKLVLDGKSFIHKTGSNGLSDEHITRDARSKVEVFIKNLQGNWQQLASTLSGHGKKIITLVSPDILFNDQLQSHPSDAPTGPTAPRRPPAKPDTHRQPPAPKPPSGDASKNNPRVKKRRSKGTHGESVIHIEVEIPKGLTDLFALYQPALITEEMWKKTAETLVCEVEVLKAFAQVESKGAAYFRLNTVNGAYIPAILYERQVFSRLTKHAYDQDYPDISGPRRDKYGAGSSQYLRLLNAYALNQEAALQASSWGAFQILGESYPLCETQSVHKLVAAMATSEAAQITLLAAFIKHKAGGRLLKAVQEKNWRKITIYYNGTVKDRKTGKMMIRDNYDLRLESAYANLKKSV